MARLSRRARRRLRLIGLLAGVVGAVALVVALVPDRNPPSAEERSPSATAGPADLPPAEAPHMTPTPAMRREILETTRMFIETAVRRDHPERSYALVHPTLRQGMTLKQWKTGNIPVIPFPAVKVGEWKIDDARVDDVLMEVMLVPKPHSGLLSKTFLIELKRSDSGDRHWLVSSWAPFGISPAQMQADQNASGQNDTLTRSKHLSSAWLLVPLAILAIIVLAPISVFALDAYRGKRSMRRYERELLARADGDSSSSSSPS